MAEERYYGGCGLVTRPDGSKFAMSFGGIPSESTSEILDLGTMELSEGEEEFGKLGAERIMK